MTGLDVERLVFIDETWTATTVKRGNDYGKLMESLGTGEPYRELRASPENASRWKMSG